jgi:hypothetical protein
MNSSDGNSETDGKECKRGVSNDGDYRWNKIKVAKVKGLQHTNCSSKVISAKSN